MLGVPQHEATCALLSRVTATPVTRGSVHAIGLALTLGAACPLVLGLLGWIAHGDGGGKVAEREGTHNSSTTASSSPAAEIPCQITELKLMELKGASSLENECIHYTHVKQKSEKCICLHFVLQL